MDSKKIKTVPAINLKPNAYFVDVDAPYLYQRRMILMMLTHPRMINGDDVGLGKTIEDLVMFTYLKAARPETRMLVLTEKLAFKQWLEELERFTVGLTAKIITSATHPKASDRTRAFRQHGADILVTGYSQMYAYSHHVLEGLGKRWIFSADEPNYFKNSDTLLYKNVRGLTVGDVKARPYRIIRSKLRDGSNEDKYVPITHGAIATRSYGLTATIIENRLEEAFGVFSVVAPHCFQSSHQFEKDYCKMRRLRRRGIRIVTGYKNLDKFRKQIEPFFYGRLQDDPEVEQDLPEVVTKNVPIVMGKAQSLKVLEAMDRIIEMPDGETKQVMLLPSMILAQQLVDAPSVLGFNLESVKMDALKEVLTNSLRGERVLIFSKLRRVIDFIEDELRRLRVDTVRITGKENDAERVRSKERFMSDGHDRCNVILGTKAIIKAVNLQKGAHLFMFDIPWSYGWYRQLVGRLKRTGSIHSAIGVYRMVACLHPDVATRVGTDHTIDHYAIKVIMKKFKLWQAITGDVKEIDSVTSDLVDIFQQIKASYKHS